MLLYCSFYQNARKFVGKDKIYQSVNNEGILPEIYGSWIVSIAFWIVFGYDKKYEVIIYGKNYELYHRSY